ncbi:PH domain-containing protein [Kutzneria buriramensis]|uniref:PH domain-containing protein n=1 Tax=Kutzneria buriramensis TaxID=1045776 RepID=UPI001FE6003D|nr:PH domain-containing protein [Kutzneria buriramensis]
MSETTGVRLRAPRHPISKKAIPYWTVRALPGWIVLLVIEVLVKVLPDDPPGAWLTVAIVVTVVLALVHLAVMPSWRYRVHRWEVTPTAVYTQSGWIDQEWRVAPLSRIQTVDTERGPFEQMFGLAKVTVTTASAAGPLHIHGLDLDVARQLVDDLTAATEASEGDAT